jgi:replicative DNA helicase
VSQVPSPQSVESEQALLGGLLLDPERFEEIEREVGTDDFYRPDHGRLFGLLKQMRVGGEPIDQVSVGERVLRGGKDEEFGGYGYVLALPEKVPARVNLGHYARIVREKALQRRVIRAAEKVLEEARSSEHPASELVSRASHAFLELADDELHRDWEQVSAIVDREMMRLQEIARDPTPTPGLTTGFTGLDKLLAGFHPGALVILAARPAMGKTALALNFAQNAAVLGHKAVGVFSLEMDRGELVNRMLCCAALVEGDKAKRGQLDDEDWERLDAADRMMREARIFIDDTSGVTIDDLRARARRLKARNPDLGMIVVDYLQLMQGSDPKAPRQQQISDISRGLKIVAKELGITVLALSQLNRGVETRAEKKPMIADLRESGAIEQDADVILFIYRDEVYNPDTPKPGIAEVIVAKHRAGPTGSAELVFRKSYTRFDDLDERKFEL